MAVLNSKEKLIQQAAQGNNLFLKSVYKKFETYFKAECSTDRKVYDDYTYINYLYCQDHKNKTFDKIARDVFGISVSTLEDRRAFYIQIFYFYLENEQAESEAAITY